MTRAQPLPRHVLNTVGTAYMGDVLRAALREADEVHICVAFLRYSGLGLVLKELETFTARGGQLRVIVSTYLNITQPGAVRVLAALSGAQIKLQTGPKGFHTKYYMFGRGRHQRTCWVGSSNFTKSGLFSSVEWNTCHDDLDRVLLRVWAKLFKLRIAADPDVGGGAHVSVPATTRCAAPRR